MNTGASPSPVASSLVSSSLSERTAGACLHSGEAEPATGAPGEAGAGCEERGRVFGAADHRLLREALAKIIARLGSVEVMASNSPSAFDSGMLVSSGVQVLLLVSQGNIQEDLTTIQCVRSAAPLVRILLIGSIQEDGEFLQCVRAGISGYLWNDASADDVLNGIRAVQAGQAVCPGELCTVLFRYFERETPELPCASPRQRLGLTRREQQLVPLIAKGFTNKEIANHFCLSEQTVKNHLYRMKHKIGAEDRLSIVQRFRNQGFLL
jgi:DNA-binding NarL/FixJ family response regulator